MDADDMSEVAPAAVLKQDTLCVRCGYNLRTLSREGRCPECGAAVAASLVAGPFGGAGRKWMAIVAVGLGLLLVASGLMVCAVALGREWEDWTAAVFAAGPGGPKTAVAGHVLRRTTPRWLAVLSLLVHAVGVMLMMWPEEERGIWSRGRMIVLNGMAIGVLLVGAVVAAGWRDALPISWSYQELLPLLLLLDAVAIVVMNLRIAEIVARDKRRAAKISMWVSMGAQLAGFLLLTTTLVKLAADSEGVWLLAAFLQAAGAALASAISVWLIVVLIRARRRILGTEEEGG